MDKYSQATQVHENLNIVNQDQQTLIDQQQAEIDRLKHIIEESQDSQVKTPPQPVDPKPIPSDQNHPQKTSVILLVEDHHIASKVVKAILSDLNCQVDIAMDGKMALEAVEKNHYDLIFMDIGLPGMNGYEITRRIRSQALSKGTHVPIIALTAHSDSQNQQLCLDAAMNAIVTKPLRREKAEDILNEFIPHRRKWFLETQEENLVDHDFFKLEEKIIDFEYAKAFLVGNATVMNETLTTFIDSLPWEARKLQEAYQQGDWEKIMAIVHRLKGGASYCGTLRLESACTKLDNYMKLSSRSLRSQLYQQLLSEIETLQKFMRDQRGALSEQYSSAK